MNDQPSIEDQQAHSPLSEKTSDLLSSLTRGKADNHLELAYLIEQFKSRSFGGLLLILSLLALLPIVSMFAGLIILTVGLQMLVGVTIPILPSFILKQKIDRASFEAFVQKLMPWLIQAEQYIRPRWFVLSSQLSQRLLGALIIFLALVSLMPLPLSNMPPSIALILLALGMLERDGKLIMLGVIVSSLALILGYFILKIVINSIQLMI